MFWFKSRKKERRTTFQYMKKSRGNELHTVRSTEKKSGEMIWMANHCKVTQGFRVQEEKITNNIVCPFYMAERRLAA